MPINNYSCSDNALNLEMIEREKQTEREIEREGEKLREIERNR